MNKHANKFYLVGIKGSGMSSLASVLHDLGYYVMGSDKDDDFGFEEGIYKRNIKVVNFDEKNIKKGYIYIIGNAYHDENPEVKKIKELHCKYYYYQDYIASMKGIHIAVSGTHGKTTTTKMIVDLLKNEKIAYIIGDGTGGAVADYKYLIYEACEYQDHFLSYKPEILVVNNIELDHPDYFSSLEQVYSSFEKMINNSKNIIMNSNIGIKKKDNFILYGLGEVYDYQIVEESKDGFVITIKECENQEIFKLPFCGKHMIDNFMKAYLVLRKLGYTIEFIKRNIINLRLPKRRMEEEIFKKQIIVKDYAHHPTEIKALYDSLSQKYPKKKLIVFFQPHTYSRTLSLSNGFINALNCFDEVYIFPTFSSAREKIDDELQKQVNEVFKKYNSCDNIEKIKIDNMANVYVFLGAGELYKQVNNFKKNF
jgi:UDP-N-acetylmuramate--alanine ligase